MKIAEPQSNRSLLTRQLNTDLVIVGGGLAGVCAAITAARAGIEVVLIQDRPVLGGNASSEVRLWILGATSHMGNNNRWAREGGVIDEILIENLYRNPEGNPLILDTILLEKVVEEPKVTLLLNTAAFEVTKKDADTIESIRAFCSQNSTMYEVHAPLFCDASGDGIIGFMAGAAFRMGAESKDEFGEGFAPEKEYGELLGHSLYFYTKDTGKPVRSVPPSYALDDITQIPRWRSFNARQHGCQLWWIEYGGRMDTIHQTEEIKWELWKVVYGVWNHIKNSGEFPEAETLTLEWVGQIPGKRESRRFEGDTMMIQQDVIEQRLHDDAVSFGGWAVDLHPADGVFSELSGCTQWHSKGVYQIPYRSMYSRNIGNLFLAGRIISASHVAFGSTRVMATCAHNGQAVGMAAAHCRKLNVLPHELIDAKHIRRLQRDLLRTGHHIPHVDIVDEDDLAASAKVTASTVLRLDELAPSTETVTLESARAMLIPVSAGKIPKIGFQALSKAEADLRVELRTCSRAESFTPDVLLAEATVPVATHDPTEWTEIDFEVELDSDRYVMVCFMPNPDVTLKLSNQRLTGVLSLSQSGNKKVSKRSIQQPPEGIGIDTFEFWLPERRPDGKNLAMKFDPPLNAFEPKNVSFGPQRPTSSANAWVADADDSSPWIELCWDEPKQIERVIVALDTDFDHALESVLMGHPESEIPFCASTVRILDESNRVLAERKNNHQTICDFRVEPIQSVKLRIELEGSAAGLPVSVFRVQVFGADAELVK
ncbi:pyridine nucleotide-disulfide oxidoreductase [Rhodopirellula maiorica SM1]|uniref:Pyridine nucleotide-disulfide oxidoreductase n=1 Tax=Rhodopirellula maiorica SM1 TaxID=1265738 RepID=M5REC4_9BACT|nr:FAD-dependent oxidoreductase [Rhodopirellula maiorica]EMI17735.1 pyridine nucleotide-disulfide oxidoreductase [Rhodopirellula maiorica SM1]